jgi:hypothetical protein
VAPKFTDEPLARGTGWLLLVAVLGAALGGLGLLSGLGAAVLYPHAGWAAVAVGDWLCLFLGIGLSCVAVWGACRMNRSRDSPASGPRETDEVLAEGDK